MRMKKKQQRNLLIGIAAGVAAVIIACFIIAAVVPSPGIDPTNPSRNPDIIQESNRPSASGRNIEMQGEFDNVKEPSFIMADNTNLYTQEESEK